MVEPPTREQLWEYAMEYYAFPSSEDAAARTAVDARWESDSANAFLRRFRIDGDDGPLNGYEVGIKGNLAIAGVEMTCGSHAFAGYVPTTDAVVVDHILAAGASVTGTLNLEAMAFSGSGEISDFGPVPNPHDGNYLAGGSSSGCAVAVVEELVDVALGTDQSGSVHVPAAWSGCVGLKPTFGLVPYTGGVSLEPTIDHTGPMTSTVADCTLILDAIAGAHPSDTRQPNPPTVTASDGLSTDEPLTIGLLAEGFSFAESDPAVSDRIRATLNGLERCGHDVETVSVPLHDDGYTVYNGIALEAYAALVRDEGAGYYRHGASDPALVDHFGSVHRSQMDEFPHELIATVAFGRYLATEYRGRYHALAQQLRRKLSAQYDAVLADVDVLAMPTTPQTAHERQPEASLVERIERSANMFQNTAPFNLTGHPAISVPCGFVGGLPVGPMFIGSQFADATVLRAARAVEKRRQTQNGTQSQE